MARFLHRGGFPAVAASTIAEGVAVKLNTGDVEWQVLPGASVNDEPFGITKAAASNPGDAVALHDSGLGAAVRVLAGASIGAGADAGVASTNGALGPVAGASGSVKYRVGQSLSAAAAGEYFALYVRPKQLSGHVV